MIAIVTMLIDHSAKALLYNGVLRAAAPLRRGTGMYDLYRFYRILRGVGRLAFPIFCFLLIEGFIHTRDRRKYVLRLFLFGLLSEIPFDLGLYENWHYPAHQNVMFELALGILMLWVWETIGNLEKWNHGIRLIAQGIFAAAFMAAADRLHLDYGFKGLCLILVLYILRYFREEQCTAGAVVIGIWEWPAVFAFPLIALYNGRRGRSLKYFFYAFYPAHLLLLALLSAVFKNGI